VSVPFTPGDRLVLYTDGFIEARDRRGRFHDLAARVRAHAGRPLEDMVAVLRRDLLRHVHDDLDDDAALVAIERLPGGGVGGTRRAVAHTPSRTDRTPGRPAAGTARRTVVNRPL
jgi:hypothetical protein